MTPSSKNSKKLILNLLLATDQGTLTTAEAVKAGQLLGVAGGNVRVTLTRLAAAGLLESSGRAEYRLSAGGKVLGEAVAVWRTAEDRLRPWNGGWIAVLTGNLPKAARTPWRARYRALALVGLKELDRDLYLRPDNFAGGVVEARERLMSLGLGIEMPVFLAQELDPARDRRARSLWDARSLVRRYRNWRRRLEAWLSRYETKPTEIAAREAFVLGDAAIHELVFDPMLPEPLVDTAERRAFTEVLITYDRVGKEIWRRFLGR